MHSNIKNSYLQSDEDAVLKKENNFVFYGLIIYTMMFYSQFASRIPFLGPFRLELVFGSILVIYAMYKFVSGEVPINENRANYAAILFIIAAFITIPFALVKTFALETFISLLKFFAIYLMIVTAVDTEKKLKKFIFIYLCMITLLFFEPFLLSLQGKGFMWNNHMWRLAGVTNYFGHPNQLGGITSANLPFFYYFMRYFKSKKMKLLCLVLLLTSLRVIMLTQSRTAFVGVMAFGFIVWLLSDKKLISLLIIIFASIVIWQFTPQETKNRFISLGDASQVISGTFGHEEAGSMYSRWVLILRGLEAFRENPIIGLGLKNFISFNGQRYGSWMPPHNTIIQVLAEMGITGFIIFLSVIIFTFRNLQNVTNLLARMDEKDSFLYWLSRAVMVYFFVRIIVSMFGQDLYANYWWLASGLSLVILRVTEQKYQEYIEMQES